MAIPNATGSEDSMISARNQAGEVAFPCAMSASDRVDLEGPNWAEGLWRSAYTNRARFGEERIVRGSRSPIDL